MELHQIETVAAPVMALVTCFKLRKSNEIIHACWKHLALDSQQAMLPSGIERRNAFGCYSDTSFDIDISRMINAAIKFGFVRAAIPSFDLKTTFTCTIRMALSSLNVPDSFMEFSNIKFVCFRVDLMFWFCSHFYLTVYIYDEKWWRLLPVARCSEIKLLHKIV